MAGPDRTVLFLPRAGSRGIMGFGMETAGKLRNRGPAACNSGPPGGGFRRFRACFRANSVF
jgi:hypothetical protein